MLVSSKIVSGGSPVIDFMAEASSTGVIVGRGCDFFTLAGFPGRAKSSDRSSFSRAASAAPDWMIFFDHTGGIVNGVTGTVVG